MRLRALRHSPLGYGPAAESNPDPDLTASWLEPCRKDPAIGRDLAVLLGHIAVTDLTDEATRFPQFTKPVTLIWGMRDRCFRPSLARRMAALFPDATMVEVPGARTFVSVDNPPAVIDAIAAVGAHRD